MSQPGDDLLDRLLVFSAEPHMRFSGVNEWWRGHQRIQAGTLVDRALLLAVFSDRLAWAFASGYACAVEHLVPTVGGRPAALCASEEGGAHPRAIKARLEKSGGRWLLNGTKTFVTLGTHAADLLVVASKGVDEDGRNRLKLVRVPADAEGISVEALPQMPFVPELPHARVIFSDVRVRKKDRLKGDGYTRYLKPFRTVEDVYVHAALLAWLLGVARRSGWPHAVVEELLVLIAAARDLTLREPNGVGVHVTLGGLIRRSRALIEACGPHWESAPPRMRERWERDRALLEVASTARGRRLEVAWERLAQTPPPD